MAKSDNRLNFYYWNIVTSIITVIIVALAAAVCLAVIIIVANSMSVQRYCLWPANFTNVGDNGMMTLDSSNGEISWEIHYTKTTENILAIYINGPVPIGLTSGDLDIALCGSPSVYVCDISTVGITKGRIGSYNGNSLKSYITAIRNYPIAFYVSVIYDVSGEVIYPMGINCGF